jgi:thiamine kinase-like enzyme
VVKRIRNWKSRLEVLVTDRWLPGAGLGGLGPPRLAALAESDGRYVWHIYDDLGPWGLDRPEVDDRSIEAAMNRVADLHAHFARNAMLPEPRFASGDLGAYFYSRSVRDAVRSVTALGPPALELSADEQRVRDEVLELLHHLLAEERERVQLIEQDAGPETLLHGDLTTANVFVRPVGGGKAVRLIDWDHAGVGPAAFDLSTHVSYYSPDKRQRVLDHYTNAMAERGYPFGDHVDWTLLLATFEAGRLTNQIIWVAICILQHDGWTFDDLAAWGRSLATVMDGTLPAQATS